MSDIIMNYWWLFVISIAVIVLVVYGIILFIKYPKSKQITKVKEWLFYAVMVAEKELGNGTGQLKLRYVYDMFIVKFPNIAIFISFDRFSSLVDDSLQKFKELLEKNSNVKQYVSGESKESNVDQCEVKLEGDV